MATIFTNQSTVGKDTALLNIVHACKTPQKVSAELVTRKKVSVEKKVIKLKKEMKTHFQISKSLTGFNPIKSGFNLPISIYLISVFIL